MVLFITGKCKTGCFYCPVSDSKMGSDNIFANELMVSSLGGIIEEAESMNALGTGITGGDPLMRMDRTLQAIRMLKEHFGNEHHIHLYTSTIDLEKVKELASAGLDEIRFHPSATVWRSVKDTELGDITKIEGLDVGIEVPALPDHEDSLKALVKDAYELGVKFINLNELEFSETNWDMMDSMGYDLKDDSSAVAGSEEVALNVIKGSDVPIHFCSSSFKDSVQLRRRLIRRAENTAREMDVVTEDGTVLKGLLYTDNVEEAIDLLKEYDVPDELFFDCGNGKLEVAPWVLEELSEELPYKCYIIEEYPTADRLEVERTPLN
jgi:Uncharacterized conserved protein related to pyruvate formate-lyase activating enzyme